jgi:hypothetical protein
MPLKVTLAVRAPLADLPVAEVLMRQEQQRQRTLEVMAALGWQTPSLERQSREPVAVLAVV